MDCSNLSIGQTGNNSINNSNSISPAPQNNTSEFYLPLPNDTRIYHVTYTELTSTEIARRLNNGIDLSNIPNHRLPYHNNVQRLIMQEIIQQSVDYQQNTIPRQSFDTMDIQPIFKEHPDDNAYDASSIPSIQQSLDYRQEAVPQQSFDTMDAQPIYQACEQPFDYQQDVIPQQSFDTMDIHPNFQEYSNNNANNAFSVPPNSPEYGYDGVQSHQNN
ncbi:hypothetical protein RhiirA5_419288 [Rhizophagus irregularis]|uniref:Uncharacterized protein n=1 Tax=Rhizophagus irregularis TaxID=588596 RepID=A0A2I1EQM2_9GLOM|nr:hypothetical protein RhiirA5_421114 [Rhizophagus irregularis]PKC06643.1 hypothetical protein RhiirA5_419288 [Rhizophagus irregularis]PKC64532.1 hypothetical protein RhiirA1_516658 [Rhizophagus irregularis]PKY24437.1 hypothetical protein RhiirB3_508491 [Rhizophagus irregularis]CAB4493037.1 unnamed protein product [Rhizophagus irregularis]